MANITRVNVTDWADWERPDMSAPYAVISAPVGETITRYFATEAEAIAEAEAVAALTGTYMTSWGEQPISTEARIILHHVDTPAPSGATVTVDELSDVMEFDHVIRVHADGTVQDMMLTRAPLYAPDVREDYPGHIDPATMGDWAVLNGYSSQYGYSGPIMHESEYIGGRMAADILADPGYYVATVVYGDNFDAEAGDDAESFASGWAVLYRPAE